MSQSQGVDITEATVATTSPLRITMPFATQSQAATSHWSGTLSVGQRVIVIIMPSGTTYVQGPA